MNIDTALLINRAKRTDRLQAFMEQWDKLRANHPRVLKTQLYRVTAAEPTTPTYTGRVQACTMSHHKALGMATGNTLILEDDAILDPYFWEVIEDLRPSEGVIAGWDMIQLGGAHITKPTNLQNGLVRCGETLFTHAYIVSQTSALHISHQLNLYSQNTIDHEFNRLKLRRYAPTRWIANQAAGYSDILQRDLPEKGPTDVYLQS